MEILCSLNASKGKSEANRPVMIGKKKTNESETRRYKEKDDAKIANLKKAVLLNFALTFQRF